MSAPEYDDLPKIDQLSLDVDFLVNSRGSGGNMQSDSQELLKKLIKLRSEASDSEMRRISKISLKYLTAHQKETKITLVGEQELVKHESPPPSVLGFLKFFSRFCSKPSRENFELISADLKKVHREMRSEGCGTWTIRAVFIWRVAFEISVVCGNSALEFLGFVKKIKKTLQ